MKLLFDSDFLFALFVPHDSHHQEAKRLAPRLANEELFVSRLVIFESATVLSYKVGQRVSISFLEHLPSLNLIKVDVSRDDEVRAWNIFTSRTKNGTSFIDCSNIALLEHYHFDRIMSFDTFYHKDIRLLTE